MAQLDERGQALYDTIEVASESAATLAQNAVEALEADDIQTARSELAEALRNADKAYDAQRRLDNLS